MSTQGGISTSTVIEHKHQITMGVMNKTARVTADENGNFGPEFV